MIVANLEKRPKLNVSFIFLIRQEKSPKRAVASLLDPFADISFALCQDLLLTPNSAVSLMKLRSPKLPNRKFNSMYLK